MVDEPSLVRPGSTIGIFGGGQLGRMTALAARSLGYRVATLDPDAACPAAAVSDRVVTGRFDDAAAAEALAVGCDVLTLEIEQIGADALDRAGRHAPLRPGAGVMRIIGNRGAQRAWLDAQGFPTGSWRPAGSAAEIATAVAALGGACFVKAVHGGYDGRSQVRVDGAAGATEAFELLGGRDVVVERALELDVELSVMVARSPDGRVAVYPAALNHHEHRILAWSVLPAPVEAPLAARAAAIARAIAERIGVVGLLAVELFVTRGGELLVNELAPRPHNSYHESELACPTSQFEQLVRAVCGLPLGATEVIRPAAIVNLLGDLWVLGEPPPFERALALDGVRLFLYGKASPRPGRKMGHLAAAGASAAAAVERVLAAKQALGGPVAPGSR